MRGLANYVSRGRLQALLVAVLCAGIPLLFWLSATVIGLVTLRQGLAEGLLILLWALLPAAAMAWMGEVVPLATLIGVALLAALLRATASWQLVLLAAVALGLSFSGLLLTLGHNYIAGIEALFAEVLARLSERADAGTAFVPPGAKDISGMFGLVHVMALVICLLLARSCQASLVNPGGLQREFHALRMEPLATVGLFALATMLLFVFDGFAVWGWIALVPLLLAGLALVHGLVAKRGLGTQWLVLTYLGLLLLPPVKQGLIVLAAADSWLDFRNRPAART